MSTPEKDSRRGLAVVLSGPSGVGKTTICKLLAERCGYELSVSVTTRAPRAGETDGVDYTFCSPEEFRKRIEGEELLEYSEHFGNMYGTPVGPVEDALREGRTILLEIDVNGARQVMERLPDAFCIFLSAPDLDEMRRRLRDRHSETDADIRTRLQRADMEISAPLRYDARVVNDNLATTTEEVYSLIREAEARTKHEG